MSNAYDVLDLLVLIVFYAFAAMVTAYLVINGFTEVFTGETRFTPETAMYTGIANITGGLAVAGFAVALASL
jgi:hypothetical protein